MHYPTIFLKPSCGYASDAYLSSVARRWALGIAIRPEPKKGPWSWRICSVSIVPFIYPREVILKPQVPTILHHSPANLSRPSPVAVEPRSVYRSGVSMDHRRVTCCLSPPRPLQPLPLPPPLVVSEAPCIFSTVNRRPHGPQRNATGAESCPPGSPSTPPGRPPYDPFHKCR